MATLRDSSLYQIGSLGKFVTAEEFSNLLDNANAKYNGALWKRYANWGTPTDDREWVQGQTKTPILVRASVLGSHSPKPLRNTEGWGVYGGTLPKIGHGFQLDQDDFITLRKAAKLSDMSFGDKLIDSFVQNSTNMLGGIHNELNYMTFQAMSTGEIHDIPVDGARFDFKFPIPDENFVTPAADWYTWTGAAGSRVLTANTSANVVDDLITFQDYYTDELSLGLNHWKVSKKLFRMILAHPSVKAAYAAKYATSGNTADMVVNRSALLAFLHDELGIWPFEVIDYKSRHEEDGRPVTDAPAFDEHNLIASTTAFRPFEMKCMNSILKDRMGMGGQTEADLYALVEGRIVVLNSWRERPNIANTVDCELFAGPVFNNLREHGIVTVWKDDE